MISPGSHRRRQQSSVRVCAHDLHSVRHYLPRRRSLHGLGAASHRHPQPDAPAEMPLPQGSGCITSPGQMRPRCSGSGEKGIKYYSSEILLRWLVGGCHHCPAPSTPSPSTHNPAPTELTKAPPQTSKTILF